MEETTVSPTDLQDRALISRSQNGDQSAFEDLVRKYRQQLRSLVCWHAGPSADKDDILQHILCKVYFSLKSFDIDRPFYPWLRRIAVNRCCDEKRRLRRRRTRTFAELEVDGDRFEAKPPALRRPANPYAALRQLELCDMLQAVVGQLPEDFRKVITLHYLEQATYEEIGQVLKCTARAARVKAFRARAALRKLMLRSSCERTVRPAFARLPLGAGSVHYALCTD
jgi:RNA polymerase sigma-70 factor (ECF subfamily)